MRGTSKRKLGVGALTGACLAGGYAIAFPQLSAANVVFQDTFSNGSSIFSSGSYPTPTSDSTGYAMAAVKTTSTGAISTGTLAMTGPKSSGQITETQALFTSTSTPVVLTSVGDLIDMTVVFNETGLQGNSSSPLYVGLFSSEGANTPYNSGLTASGSLTSVNTAEKSGGTAPWEGYVVSLLAANAGSQSKIYTRPSQASAGTTNADQDLLGSNNSASYTYSQPAGSTLTNGGAGNGYTLTGGSTYTEDLTIEVTATGEQVTMNLYSGDDAQSTLSSLTPIYTNQGIDTESGAINLTSYDGFGIGWRDSANVGTTALNVDEVTVSTNVNVPEPATLGLLGLVSLGLMKRKRTQE